MGDERVPTDPEPTLWDQVAVAFASWREGTTGADPLVRLMTPVLWHVARACRLSEDAAHDVLQDVWLALVRHRDEIVAPRAVAAWLITSTRREAWRVRRETDRTTHATLAPPEDGTLDTLLPPSGTTEDEVIERDDATRLWEAVSTLSERCRKLLRVVAFSDRPDYHQLSEHLGMPVGSIGPTRGRCLGKLRQALADAPTAPTAHTAHTATAHTTRAGTVDAPRGGRS